MAHIYASATLTPSKLDLLSAWLPQQAWFAGEGSVQQAGAYRFDDPDGEVGLEAFLLRAGDGTIYHVPLTYREAPLPGGERHLVGVTDHSVLGRRWVYDACADPVWGTALATAVLTGGVQAPLMMERDGVIEPREPSTTVAGSGRAGTPVPGITTLIPRDEGPVTVAAAGPVDLLVARVAGALADGEQTLVGRWDGGGPAVLAVVREA